MKRKVTPASAPLGKRMFLTWVAVLMLIGGVYLLVKKTGTEAIPSSPNSEEVVAPERAGPDTASARVEEDTPKSTTVFQKLLGRWLREDGGYVLEIREVQADGSVQAAYFNPNPIQVSRAAAVQEGGAVKVGIELTDVGYPGCLYTLWYDPAYDQLHGTYYQAALGQTFQIAFDRIQDE